MAIRIGDYKINLKSILGRGNCGIVYKGRHRVTQDVVAAKQVLTKKEKFVEGELAAIKAASGHPNVVNLLYCKKKDDDLWLIMEYCAAGNVHEYLIKHTVTDRQAAVIIQDCVAAVCHLHTLKPQGIMHRDIKPENLLVTIIDGQPRIKICDFGVAAMVSKGTLRSTYCGTPLYFAPEFFDKKKERQYDMSVDVFALGLIIWTILHRKAYKGLEDPVDRKETKEEEEPIGLSWINNHDEDWVPLKIQPEDGLLATLLIHMTRYNPKDRPSITLVRDILSLCFNDKVLSIGKSLQFPRRAASKRVEGKRCLRFGDGCVILESNDQCSKWGTENMHTARLSKCWQTKRPTIVRAESEKCMLDGNILIMRHRDEDITYVFSEDTGELWRHSGDFGALCGSFGNLAVYCKKADNSQYKVNLYSVVLSTNSPNARSSHELVTTLSTSVSSNRVSLCRHHTGYLAVSDHAARTLDIYTPTHQHVKRVWLENRPLERNAVAAVGDVIVVASFSKLLVFNWEGTLLTTNWNWDVLIRGSIVGIGAAGKRLLLLIAELYPWMKQSKMPTGSSSNDVLELCVYEIY